MQVVSIDGQATIGWNGDQAAQLLRGRSGSSVVVRLARRTLAVPGVPARPEPPLPTRTEYKQVLAFLLFWVSSLLTYELQLILGSHLHLTCDRDGVGNPLFSHVFPICGGSDIWF